MAANTVKGTDTNQTCTLRWRFIELTTLRSFFSTPLKPRETEELSMKQITQMKKRLIATSRSQARPRGEHHCRKPQEYLDDCDMKML
ncbi:hypothetical protein K7X08_020704 [Anisodus acutangulus]|uniref:Uncharacterized protein n=1 Tax=Anisodus acutangulus TaxID=402998 RepID=A0A9Q1MT27_9SOLA|nr:hypothetical protein K7X08_020704 [Anisodus acutangulus]